MEATLKRYSIDVNENVGLNRQLQVQSKCKYIQSAILPSFADCVTANILA